MERYILKDNEARSRYEFDLGGHTAYIDYEKDNGTIVLTHTFVPEAYEGRGVGAQLVAAALADIRRQGLKVVPQCSFVAVYIKRHPEWSDMVSETACDTGQRSQCKPHRHRAGRYSVCGEGCTPG